jgi:hypothetical protein
MLAALCAACATGGPDPALLIAEQNRLESTLSAAAAPAPGALRVRLAFGSEADLDLYVTDPAYETVYFANTPARSGGRLERDLRCDAPQPRVETVAFEQAPAGRYRVGVDFPERCDGGDDPVAFVVVVESGERRELRRRTIAPGHFVPIVLELDLAP